MTHLRIEYPTIEKNFEEVVSLYKTYQKGYKQPSVTITKKADVVSTKEEKEIESVLKRLEVKFHKVEESKYLLFKEQGVSYLFNEENEIEKTLKTAFDNYSPNHFNFVSF